MTPEEVKKLDEISWKLDRIMQHMNLTKPPETKERPDPMARIGARTRNQAKA